MLVDGVVCLSVGMEDGPFGLLAWSAMLWDAEMRYRDTQSHGVMSPVALPCITYTTCGAYTHYMYIGELRLLLSCTLRANTMM